MVATVNPEEEKLLEQELRARGTELTLRIAKYLTIAAVVWMIFLIVVGGAFQLPQLLASGVLFVLIIVAGQLFPILHRRGRTRAGINFLLASILFVSAAMSFFVPEILMNSLIGCVIIVIVAHLLLGSRDSRWVGVACVVAFIVDALLVYLGRPDWLPMLEETSGTLVTVLIGIVTLAGAIVVIARVMTDQEMVFRQAKRANLQVEEYAEAEKKQREYIQSTVQQYVRYTTQVGQGDLATRLKVHENERGAEDPLVVLGHNLNDMVVSLQRMILQIRDAASDLSSATAEILTATTQQVSGANEQSAAITQTTTTVDEVKTIAEQSVKRAQEVVDVSQRTVQVSRSGRDTVQETIVGMGRIKERVEGIAQNILALSEQTQRIGEITATVNDIAAQSNMLALNASVEAARAGEHGRGFSVVAAEVRSLAEQSQQATAQVRSILSSIQKGINDTVISTEEGTKVVEEGVRLAALAQEAIERLAAVIDESAQMATQVVAGGRQQASGVEQISIAMQNINQATVQSLSSTSQTEKATRNLNELARSLSEAVEQYQL
jgi:methyl-accepting chemotaxis protein